MDSRMTTGPDDGELCSSYRRCNIEPARPAGIPEGNVWAWIHEVTAASPVQPIANLGTGFVDYGPPKFVVDAYKKALDNAEYNQYAPIIGLPSLRSAISQTWSPFHGRTLDPDTEICVCNGAQGALLSTLMAFVRPGDEVILLEPVFELYVYQLKLIGATPIYVPLRPSTIPATGNLTGNDWTINVQELEAAVGPKTKAIILNNPHNPLGKVFTPSEIICIGRICITHELLLVSDEVYERIAFDSPFTRAASIHSTISARTLTTVSLGKLFNATGWRVGFVVGRSNLIRSVQNVHALLAYVSNSPAQEACARGLIEANQNRFWEENRKDVKDRVKRVCDILDDVGLPYIRPLGAYFIFVDISKIQVPSWDFPETVIKRGSKDWKVCYYLVNELGIASVPGSCFYGSQNRHLGESFIRLGVCKSDESLKLAEERLQRLKSVVV